MIDFGFAGWMADFGEYTPMDATSKYADRYVCICLVSFDSDELINFKKQTEK